MLQNFPAVQTHRFIHGLLSTEKIPTIHFMLVYESMVLLMLMFIKTPKPIMTFCFKQFLITLLSLVILLCIYIGMDANTDTLSSQSISRAYLSQRWYDVGYLLPQIQQLSPQPTWFAKGSPLGRRIDYVFANSPAISTITSFHLDCDLLLLLTWLFPLPNIFYISLPKPMFSLPNAFHSSYAWDISKFQADIGFCLNTWARWGSLYPTGRCHLA